MRIEDFYPFSYSSISTYKRCPLRWKFIYVDRMPMVKRGYLSFGTTIHLVLKYILMGPLLPSLDDVINRYRTVWISDGYTTRTEEERYFNTGIDIINKFYSHVEREPKKIAYVEYPVTGMIGDIPVTGIIDRIDYTENNNIEIIDYKTSSRDYSYTDVENTEQLLIYQILAEKHFKKNVEKLSIFNLRSTSKVTVGRMDIGKIKQFENSLSLVDENIANGFFEPVQNEFCSSCDFQGICPLFREENIDEEGKELVSRFAAVETGIQKMEKEREEIIKKIVEYSGKKKMHRIAYDDFVVTVSHKKEIYFDDTDLDKLPSIIPAGNDKEGLAEAISKGNIPLSDVRRVIKKLKFKDLPEVTISKRNL